MKIKKNSILAVDLDNSLCRGEAFTDMDCILAKPIWKKINRLKVLNQKGVFIIIYTARREWLRNATEYWLKKHEVYYNILDVGHKVWANVYADDRAINIKDL